MLEILLFILVSVLTGKIEVGEEITLTVDTEKRHDTARNHTATHLLMASLRQVLGNHVEQAGSLVAPARLRFDFTHFQAVTPDELNRIEELINEKYRKMSCSMDYHRYGKSP